MGLFVFYIFLFSLAKPIWADEIIFQDNFNQQNLDNWQVVRNQQYHHPELPCFFAGYPAQWQIKNGQLGIEIESSPCSTEIIPSDLDLTKTENYELEFDWSFPNSIHMDRNVLLKWQDKDNWYGLHLIDHQIILQKVINGQLADLYNNWGYFPFAADQTYSFKIKLSDDRISVFINDQVIIETVDRAPFLTGFKAFGFQASSGNIFNSSSFFDNITITSLNKIGEKKLNLHPYLQDDPAWKNQEYDQASAWSEKIKIGDWGCALSSAVMILNHYGINQVPSGQALNPAQLNLWLKSQPDGYVGEGLVNWLAVTRLTHEMSQVLETPVLEYEYLEGEIETAIKNINQDQPVIIQVPGHFLVADGYSADQDDLFIKDPAYDYQLLSQHQADLLSIRSFTPSFTDLSYLLIVHDPAVKVTLINQSPQYPDDLKIYSEFLSNLNSDGQTPLKVIQSLAKPNTKDYLLKTENNTQQESLIEIYTYNQQGQVKILSQLSTDQQIFSLNLNQNQATLIEVTDQFTLLRDLLQTLYLQKEITTKYAYLKLDQLAAYAENDKTQQPRYLQLLKKTILKLDEFTPTETLIKSLADPP